MMVITERRTTTAYPALAAAHTPPRWGREIVICCVQLCRRGSSFSPKSITPSITSTTSQSVVLRFLSRSFESKFLQASFFMDATHVVDFFPRRPCISSCFVLRNRRGRFCLGSWHLPHTIFTYSHHKFTHISIFHSTLSFLGMIIYCVSLAVVIVWEELRTTLIYDIYRYRRDAAPSVFLVELN
jgi:hypothetical protein